VTSMIPATTAATATTTSAATTTQPSNPNGVLNNNSFLQLMVTQLQHQDPLNPTDGTNYLSQLAQFTALEQETNTATATTKLTGQADSTEALNLLGKTVQYLDSTGAAQSGQVTGVTLAGTTPTLTVGTTGGIATSQVTSVS
jgi:flagellar basal-body rod modification protein FlgD